MESVNNNVNDENRQMNTDEHGNEGNVNSREHSREHIGYKEWFRKVGWTRNPFVLSVNPDLLVGYEEQTRKLMEYIDEGRRLILIKGPTGSGKTTLMRWTENHIKNYKVLFLAKPPSSADEFVEIFQNEFPVPWFLRPFIPNIKNIYQIPKFVNKKLNGKRIVILIDEIHEAPTEVLEWVRVFSDQINDAVIVLSGLPSFELMLKEKLETLERRITARIDVLSLTKENVHELIQKRIESVGGKGTYPFTDSVIEKIFERTNGFPRDVLKTCEYLVEKAVSCGRFDITEGMLSEISTEKKNEKYNISYEIIYNLSPRQQEIVEILAKGDMTPGQVANALDLSDYKSRQHAVRSVNNILQRLVQEGYVERRRVGKAFVYALMPKIKNMLVNR